MKSPSTGTAVRFAEFWHFNIEPPWVTRHSHPEFHELVLLLRGSVRTQIGGKTFLGKPGNVLLYPQGMVHEPRTEGPGILEFLDLRWTGGEKIGRLHEPGLGTDRDGRVRHQLLWIADQYQANPQDQSMLDALTYSAVHEFVRLLNPSPRDLVAIIRRYIREHITQPISLDDLASAACLSRFHFVRRFRAVAGVTPMHYLIRMRLDAACDLILQTDLKLDAIAAGVGLADASHLAHLFRRVLSTTPGALRRQVTRHDAG